MFNALIRTHHITSRKKIAVLKEAAKSLNCHAVLRSGGVPGVMYVEGHDSSTVRQWVDVVHGLRYKDYQLVASVAPVACSSSASSSVAVRNDDSAREVREVGVLREIDTVKEMAAIMQKKGLTDWFRLAMGFAHG